MELFRQSKMFLSVILLVLGILFVTMKSAIISVAITVLGAFLIVQGIRRLIAGSRTAGIVELAAGACVMLMGWTVVSLTLYLLAVVMVVYGISECAWRLRSGAPGLGILSPALTAITGIILFFNQGGAVNGVFTAAGVLLIVDGVIGLLDSFRAR